MTRTPEGQIALNIKHFNRSEPVPVPNLDTAFELRRRFGGIFWYLIHKECGEIIKFNIHYGHPGPEIFAFTLGVAHAHICLVPSTQSAD